MKSTLTLYEVCNNEHGALFDPVSGFMTSSKRKALAELRETRTHCPEVYLAQITYMRLPDVQKGR